MAARAMEAKNEAKRTLMEMRSDERLAQKIATEILPNYPAISILDIGCGDGIVSKHLPENIQYLGLDINEACIYEQKHDNPLIRYVQPNAIQSLMGDAGPWEMILLFDVLEHTRGFINLFEAAMQSSSKYVAVSLPNELFILDRLRMMKGKELNAHSLDLVAQPEGFKHQYIINIDKARDLLMSSAKNLGFKLTEEILRPLRPRNLFFIPISKILTRITSEQLWSQGSIFIFERQSIY